MYVNFIQKKGLTKKKNVNVLKFSLFGNIIFYTILGDFVELSIFAYEKKKGYVLMSAKQVVVVLFFSKKPLMFFFFK